MKPINQSFLHEAECVATPQHTEVNYRTTARLVRYARAYVARFIYLGHVVNKDTTDDGDMRKQTKEQRQWQYTTENAL